MKLVLIPDIIWNPNNFQNPDFIWNLNNFQNPDFILKSIEHLDSAYLESIRNPDLIRDT